MIGVIVLVIRKISGKEVSGGSSAQPVRLFFQYALAFGLFIIVNIGLAGLLGRVIDPSNIVSSDQAGLASNLAFVVVGGPLLAGISIWIKRSIAANPHDGQGFVPTFFATLAAVISLLVFMSTVIAAAQAAVSNEPFYGQSLSSAIVWGIALAVVIRIANRVLPPADFRIHYFVGSLITAIAGVVGLVKVISGSLSVIFGLQESAIVTIGNSSAIDGLIILVVAAALWVFYWVKNANQKPSTDLWFGYVLLAGVGGSLVLAVTSSIIAIYRVLVWFVGDPTSDVATTYFAGTPTAVSSALVGTLAWWYHKSLLPLRAERTETNRVYEYLMSAISLIASTVGLAIVIVALIEALTPNVILDDEGVINTLLGAATVILVGAPVWWHYWSRIQKLVKQSPDAELSSPIRRVYLFTLFGVGGIAAIISLITVVFQLFEGILSSNLGASTVNEMRFALGILISTGIVAGYHWEIYRHEKDVEVAFTETVPNVLLVGPKSNDLFQALKDSTGAKVTYLQRADLADTAWPIDHVVELVSQSKERNLLVLLETTGVKVIPIIR